MNGRAVFAAAALLALAGCGDWAGESEGPPLPGNREAVLTLERALKPDPRLLRDPVKLPRQVGNRSWPQPGGQADHATDHLRARKNLKFLWRSSIGVGSDSETHLLADPVVAGGRVYTLDVRANLRVFDAKRGNEIWRVALAPDDDNDGMLGGGIAVDGGRIYVTTGFARVFALDAKTGKIIWQRPAPGPIRAGPTVHGGRLFYVSLANELVALRTRDGYQLWSHTGITEPAALVGAASPAVAGGVVVAPFSSGEIIAVKVENGRMVWSDALAALRRTNPVSALPHIRARPVIYRGHVFIVGHSGRMVAINLRTGTRIWEKPVGGIQPPWVAGDLVYMVSLDGELVAMSRATGAVRWIVELPRYKDPKDRKGRISWAGPVLAGGNLYLASSHGQLWSVRPETGKVLRTQPLSDDVFIPPVVAGGTLYLLTDDADLLAYR